MNIKHRRLGIPDLEGLAGFVFAVELDPGYAEARLNLARAYRALAGIEGLPARFKRLTTFALAIEYRGEAYLELERLDDHHWEHSVQPGRQRFRRFLHRRGI